MDDLKIIKKKYGEKMMHLCRNLFPSILETPGLLSDLVLKHFEPSKFLYNDLVEHSKIEEFRRYIYSFVDEIKKEKVTTQKTPHELMDEAGYILYECKTEEDIQAFKKYYAPGEELCTFLGGRLYTCHVFFAVKKNVNKIRRENFTQPKREDEYGTSVISIQFKKSPPNTVSIKNRYNHSVYNPDYTFSNNLDNIIPGLTESFEREYDYNLDDVDSKYNFEIPGYVKVNGKYYKYNYEINNIYYCVDNIIIDNYMVIDKYSKEPERYILMDYFIIDLKLKTIKLYDSVRIKDGFGSEFNNIENIIVSKNKDNGNKHLEIIYDGGKKAEIVINKANQMIEYHNHNLTEMPNYTLEYITQLENLDTPNLLKIGDLCLTEAEHLSNINVLNLVKIGDSSLCQIDKLTRFIAPYLVEVGHFSMTGVGNLREFITPNLRKTGNYCLVNCPHLEVIEVSNLTEVGKNFLRDAFNLTKFSAPKLIKLPDSCLENANNLTELYIPELVKMGSSCMTYLLSLTRFEAPKLEEIGDNCLYLPSKLKVFIAPNLVKNGDDTLKYALNLVKYKDANEEYEKEDVIPNEEKEVQDDVIIKEEKVSNSLVDRLNLMLKNKLYKIKEFKQKIIEGVKRR